MSKQFSLAAILLLCAVCCFAAPASNTLWQKGNSAYTQKQYDSAAYYFEQIAALKPQNAEVYYNLGNTYYRLNKIPQAVLNFERALHIDPDYKEAKDNLELTQTRIANHIPATADIFFVNWWHTATHPNKTTAWSVIALIAFTLMIAVMLLRRIQKSGHRIPVQFSGIFAFTCICFLVLAISAAKNKDQTTTAVVMTNDAPLMNNEQKGKPLTLVPEATTVKIKAEKGMWIEVSLPDGRTGWLQQDVITRI